MPFSLMGFEKSTAGTTYTALSNFADSLFSNGGSTTTYLVPASHTAIYGSYGLGNTLGSGGGLKRLRLDAPSFLKRGIGVYPTSETVDASTTAGTIASSTNPAFDDYYWDPIHVDANDNLGVDVITDGGTAALIHSILVIGSENQRPQELDLRGRTVIPARFTATATLTAHVWSSSALTADQALAPGTYAVVGMRYIGATAIAARVVFPGYGYRPGCIASGPAVNTPELSGALARFRKGKLGVWGTFDSTQLPQVEFLASAADTAEDVIFDLMPV